MIIPRMERALYGGNYCPSEWPREVWNEDLRLFKLARINLIQFRVLRHMRPTAGSLHRC